MDCRDKVVRFRGQDGLEVVFRGDRRGTPRGLISALQARRLLRRDCPGFLAHVRELDSQIREPASVPVAREFLDVFPNELPGLPPAREIEFKIEVMSGTKPISIPPYRMAPAELKELKDQLQELVDKGFIRPSTSHWGAPVLFVKKKDGSEFVFRGDRRGTPKGLISALQARRLLKRGCQGFLAHVRELDSQVREPASVPVVSEFLDVFPDELPGLPPDREIEFEIELLPGTRPIFIPPYRMAPA